MSSQAGVLYFDDRRIPQSEAGAILRGAACVGCNPPTSYSTEGIFLAHAALELDFESPDVRQPHTAASSAITFDGRLDNREDLLLRLRDALRGHTRGDKGVTSDAALAL